MGHTTDDDHTSVCQGGGDRRGYGGTGLEGHWRDLEGAKKKRGDNYVLPLPLHVPLEGTCLLIIPGDYSLHHVASAPEAAVGEAGRVRTRRLSCKRCDRTSPGLGTVQAFELSCSGAMEHEGHEMCWDA